jgi:hypothetical protein
MDLSGRQTDLLSTCPETGIGTGIGTFAERLRQVKEECLYNPPLHRVLRDPSMTDGVAAALLQAEENETARQVEMLRALPPGGAEMVFRSLRRRFAQATTQLRDGTTGYYERGARTDDCWAAAVATCLQVPIGEVPDPQLDRRLQAGEKPDEIDRSARHEFARWLAARSLRMTVHRTLPVRRRRWIGIVTFPGDFTDHSLVMTGGEILFDPVDRAQHSRQVRTFTPSDMSLGYSFRIHKPTQD